MKCLFVLPLLLMIAACAPPPPPVATSTSSAPPPVYLVFLTGAVLSWVQVAGK